MPSRDALSSPLKILSLCVHDPKSLCHSHLRIALPGHQVSKEEAKGKGKETLHKETLLELIERNPQLFCEQIENPISPTPLIVQGTGE